MKKFQSIEDILKRKDATSFQSSDAEYKQYVFSTLSLFRAKNTQGSLFDCDRIAREVEQIIKNKNHFKPSPLLLSQVYICMLELYLKKKNQPKYDHYYRLNELNLRTLNGQARQQQLMKLNSLILYNYDFKVLPQQQPNFSVMAIQLYRNKKNQQAIQCLKRYLNEYRPYINMKKVVIGKILLQMSNPQAFQWFEEVISTLEICEYQKYQAKLLFISGFRTLVEKLGVKMNKENAEDINIKQKKYIQQLKQIQTTCSKQKIEDFKTQYSLGFSSSLSSQQRKVHLQKSLALIKDLPCYPSPSMYEYEIRIKLTQECVQLGDFSQGKRNAQVVIGLGNKLNLFNWSRQLKVNKALAKVLEHQNDATAATQLVSRCVELEEDQIKKQQLEKWKTSLKQNSKSLTNNLKPKKDVSNSAAIERIVHGKASVSSVKPNLDESQVQIVGKSNQPIQSEKQEKSCCILI